MKKTIVSMMMAIALIAGGTAYAQTDGTTGATTQKEKCDNCKGDKGENCEKNKKENKHKQGEKGKKDRKGGKELRGGRQQFNPFDGIQLTDEQQQKLQVLQRGLGPVILDKEQQARIPENKDLTPEQKKQLKEERDANKMEAKKNYLNGVKETLTPEQYVIFLENVYLYAPQNQSGDKGTFKSGRPVQSPRIQKGKAKSGK